jgi:sugar O-acyltransferase (sialic acid O-acetyltransferase NeuD family)
MNKALFIYGAGGLGREIKAMINHLPQWELRGFYDDQKKIGSDCEGVPVLGGLDELRKITHTRFVVLAFGDPQLKLKLAADLETNSCIQFPVLIHPTAVLLDVDTIRLGSGCVISAGAALTTNIQLGKHVMINLNVTVGHDTLIGDGSSVMPGAHLSGMVKIGSGVLIGSGAVVLNKVTIEDGANVGAGAVVTKNVSSGTTVIGVPARERDHL